MPRSFLFFRPARLPLTPEELSEETVLPLADPERTRASLEQQFGAIRWDDARHGSTDVDGR